METKQVIIRKATSADFAYVRKLPVQLTQPPASALLLKQLRMMMQVSDHELIVLAGERHVSGFMALQYTPGRDSGIRFLVIKYLAVDRFALTRGAAAHLETYAVRTAQDTGCTGLLVRANALSRPALQFYRECGYSLEGNALLKKLPQGV